MLNVMISSAPRDVKGARKMEIAIKGGCRKTVKRHVKFVQLTPLLKQTLQLGQQVSHYQCLDIVNANEHF